MEKKADIRILNVVIVAVILSFSMMMIGAEQDQEPIRYNSTYSKYGYYPQQKIMVSHSGLQYNPRENGGMRILNQAGQVILTYGTCLSGNVDGSPIKRCETDYDWTWEHTTRDIFFTLIEFNESDDEVSVDYVMKKDIFTGYNNNQNLNWTKTYEFTPRDDVKITDTLTNNFGLVTNTKFWYVIKDPGVIRYNGQEYNTSEININQQGSFNNIISRVDFGAGTFLYQDMLDDGFDLVHVYIGNGTPIGYDNVRLIGLGFTKGSGNFNEGQTFILDPVSTGFKLPTTFGDPYTNWTDTSNLDALDSLYATETVNNSFAFTGGYTFGIPDEAFNITGFEIRLIGIAKESFCVARARAVMKVGLSLDNGTTLSDESISMFYPCTTGTTDTTVTKGSSTDIFGLGAMNASNISEEFRGFIKLHGIQNADPNPGMNVIGINIYYDVPDPILSPAGGNLGSNSIINSTFLVNLTTSNGINLTSAFLESNYSGTLINYSLTEEGESNNWFRYFEGKNNSADGDEGARNGSLNLTGNFIGCVGVDCDTIFWTGVNVSSALPTFTINNPTNDSEELDGTVLFNVTNTDPDDDYVDMILMTVYDGTMDIRNYLQFFDSVVNSSEVTHNQTIGTIDANDADLVRLFRMDILDRFDEHLNGNAMVYDFSNNNKNVTEGSSTPSLCSDGSIEVKNIECLEFDGIQDTLELLNGTDTELAEVFVDLNFTVGSWAYVEDTGLEVILGKGTASQGANAYFFMAQAGTIGVFRFLNATTLQCNAIVSGTSINTWNHLVFTGDGNGNITGYVNGVEVSETDCSNTVINVTRWGQDSPTYETYIGAIGTTGSINPWDGALDELFIYNRSLTAEEVKNIYNVSRSPFFWEAQSWDSPDGMNSSGIFQFNTTSSDSCTYTSGNWLIDFADNCVISSNVVGDSLADILVTGIGSLTINNGVRISGFDFLFTRDTGILNQIGSGGFDL